MKTTYIKRTIIITSIALIGFLGFRYYQENINQEQTQNAPETSSRSEQGISEENISILTGELSLNSIMNNNLPTMSGDKQILYVETIDLEDLSQDAAIIASGRIQPSQPITVTAQAAGRVENVLLTEGDTVSPDSIITTLADSIGNYVLQADQSIANVNQLRAQRAETEARLDQQIRDAERNINQAEINLEQRELTYATDVASAQRQVDEAQENLETVQADARIQLAALQQDIDNTDITQDGTISNQELQNAKRNLEVRRTQYDTFTVTNQERINSQKESVSSQAEVLYTTYKATVDLGDELLGVNDGINSDIERGYGAQNFTLKNSVETTLSRLYDAEDQLERLRNIEPQEIDTDQITIILSEIEGHYDDLLNLMINMEELLDFSQPRGQFTEPIIEQYQTRLQGQINSIQSTKNAVVNLRSEFTNFLATYEREENTQLQQIENAEEEVALLEDQLEDSNRNTVTNLERTKLSIAQSVINAQNAVASAEDRLKVVTDRTAVETALINLESARDAAQNLQETKRLQLASLDASIAQAQISISIAQNQVNRLSIRSPVSGIIDRIHIEEGEEVSPGSQIADIANTNTLEIDVALPSEEIALLEEGISADVLINQKNYTGVVTSIEQIADDQLLYPLTVTVRENLPQGTIGSIAQVSLPVNIAYPLIPVEYITLEDDNRGVITLLSGGTVPITTGITLGTIRGDSIEVRSSLTQPIITTNLNAYNPDDYVLEPVPGNE